MNNLPEKFPEYLIMYKILTKKILNLSEQKTKCPNLETAEIEKKMKVYKNQRTKIINMFPENFFKNYSVE